MYFIFAVLGLWSLHTSKKISHQGYFLVNWKYVLILFIAFAWGVLMELVQRFIASGRLFSYWDMLANLFGAFAGISFFYIFFSAKNLDSIQEFKE